MGYTVLMQWTPTVPTGRNTISDLVLSRVLEHYNITHPLRSTIQFRTFRATFPQLHDGSQYIPPHGGADSSSSPTRILTTITYSQPIPPVRDVPVPQGARDDVTYLFLEDRGVPVAVKPVEGAKEGEKAKDTKDGKEDKPEEKKEGDKDKVEEKKDGDKADAAKDATAGKPKDAADEDDDFEIVEMPKDPAATEDVVMSDATKDAEPKDADAPAPAAATAPAPAPTPRAPQRYKTLAVRPATLVMPTLHNLLSQFVLGMSKSARAASATTAQPAQPTPLQGTPLVLQSLAFPPTPHPQPALTLAVHILPNAAAQTIFLEGEWEGAAPEAAGPVLREFLLGCVPDGVKGDARFWTWENDGFGSGGGGEGGEAVGGEGWSGVEKTRRMTSLLARALRESAFI